MKFAQTWPIICTDNEGAVTEIHYNNRTMGPLQAPSHLVTPFYHAYHVSTIYRLINTYLNCDILQIAANGENSHRINAIRLPFSTWRFSCVQ